MKLGLIWKLLRSSWSCPHSQASLNEETTERIRLLLGKDEDLRYLNVLHKLILPHQEVSKVNSEQSRDELLKKMESGTCLDLAKGAKGHSCEGRSCVRIQSSKRRLLAT